MHTDIKDVLKGAMLNHQLVGIYLDPSNLSSCSVGYVDAIDNTKVRLRAISPAGKNTGYEIRLIDELYRVDVDTLYLRKIGFLHKNHDQIFSDIELIQPAENSDVLFSTLKDAKNKRAIVILWTEDKDDSMVGYVESLMPTLFRFYQ